MRVKALESSLLMRQTGLKTRETRVHCEGEPVVLVHANPF